MSDSKPDLFYQALTPFKFQGCVIKPPAFVQMSAEEARPYQAAGVVSDEGEEYELPAGGNEHPSESGTDESSDRATDGALDPAASQTAPAGVSGDGAKAPAKTRAPAKAAAPRKKAAK